MKKEIVFILLLMLNNKIYSQNLLPNHSFEDSVICPTGQGQLVYPWYTWAGAADYFNVCGNNYYGVPNNLFGYQNAYSGVAYVGLGTFRIGVSNYREYIQVLLNDTLQKDKRYYVTFYVSLMDSVQYADNDIGAYFSDSAVNNGSYCLPYNPQVYNSPNDSLTDKTIWYKISGSFIAGGGELYITIGNFKDDANTDTIFVGGAPNDPWNWDCSGYYIDDISVVIDTTVGTEKEDNENIYFKLFPNPNNGKMIIEYYFGEKQKGIFILTDIMGRVQETIELKEGYNLIEMNDKSLQSGVYFYMVKINNTTIFEDKLMIIK